MRLEEITRYFPAGIAQGDAFINRVQERTVLKKNIIANRHMLLMAPRRYGKTSLVTQVAAEVDFSCAMIDFLAVHDDESVKAVLSDKIGRLVGELLPSVQQAKEKLLSIFHGMRPELTLSAFGQKLVLHAPSNPSTTIMDLLLKLDETAVYFEKRAIVFIDEMQQISFLENAHSIEASIRHAVERSKNITYCFSGSSRHLLKQMFGDHARPLYRLCHTLEIERMTLAHYEPYLADLSKRRWGQPLESDVFSKIMLLTEVHPFYVNALCQCLWIEDMAPNVLDVERAWRQYIKDNRHVIVDDVMKLSLNQKRVLIALAKYPVRELYGADFLVKVKMTPSSTRKAVEVLMAKDLVYLDQQQYYQLVDPAIAYYLADE
ncbi:MAG: hypothetical protein A3J38_09770 [Gammaproteobacteria bacterium RIFCSPHIGHO2_12_FULL_45_9]|nr:MAG: hypothetical protein A3J38_09770 [Gammaproteobacteria bacterium RIFCSPHIGHO2_12_FULL_45_9]